MTNLLGQNTIPLQRWWVRLHRWLWRGFGFVWGTIMFGLFLSMITNVLKSKGILRWMNQNLLMGSPVGLGFLVPRILVGLAKHQSSSHLAQSVSLAQVQQSCAALVQALPRSRKELAQSLPGRVLMPLQVHEEFEARRLCMTTHHYDGSNMESPSIFSISIPFSLL
ncbi:MAG TPA: hypothetical protein VEL31_17155 [Ktedonobacteraceae bacterium]|nr:hypothetical protein [Ktedonobacteraceae bacterium]